jgi:polysaccharide pyruvyl transferase WcaK-like protein
MFSQSVGPMTDSDLIAEARRVLPRVTQIAVRENLYGPALLKALGVLPERVLVTGDDAVELAHHARKDSSGKGIGVNVRVASSTELDDSVIDVVRRVLHKAATKHQTHLIPLPIALHAGADDQRSIQRVIAGAVEEIYSQYIPKRPQQVIEVCGRCRIVVTSAYHAAVFALAQGIPAICLAANMNYTQKFKGLAAQFGAGCKVLSVNVSNFAERLREAIEQAWCRASAHRMSLLAAAARQIELSDIAYGRLAHLMADSPSPLGAAA